MTNGASTTAYSPVDATPSELRAAGIAASVAQGWAEPALQPEGLDWPARQAAALIPFEVVAGRPRNPLRLTGKVGRNLGRWGENAAADPIVVAPDPDGLRVLLIRRSDCGEWAIPGGIVDAGETAPSALVRELREETGVDLSALTPEILDRAYVDDPRNTDEAWVVSTVALFRLPAPLPAEGADDALETRWWPFPDVAGLAQTIASAGGVLYEAHRPLLELAYERLTAA